MSDDRVILTRMFDLLQWLVPRAERFLRSYRRSAVRVVVRGAPTRRPVGACRKSSLGGVGEDRSHGSTACRRV